MVPVRVVKVPARFPVFGPELGIVVGESDEQLTGYGASTGWVATLLHSTIEAVAPGVNPPPITWTRSPRGQPAADGSDWVGGVVARRPRCRCRQRQGDCRRSTGRGQVGWVCGYETTADGYEQKTQPRQWPNQPRIPGTRTGGDHREHAFSPTAVAQHRERIDPGSIIDYSLSRGAARHSAEDHGAGDPVEPETR